MSLESLANELLFDIFEYCRAFQVLQSFSNLNNRFNDLISKHFRKHRLDFTQSSKKDFDRICQHDLPHFTDDIISIGLSDDDDTPGEIDLFRSFGLTLDRFRNLRSVTFNRIRSGDKLCGILLECQQIIHLNLTACYFEHSIEDLLNSIWSLPNLIFCYLNLVFKSDFQTLRIPKQYSVSIKHLTIIGVSFDLDRMSSFCEHTPQLEYLAIDVTPKVFEEEISTPIESICRLNLSIINTQSNTIANLLRNLPNLVELKIDSCYLDLNGYEWENLIRKYLPKLKEFQLKMKFQIRNQNEMKQLRKSFQTPFWIEERQWLVQFHFNLDDQSNMIHLYTLPFNFTTIHLYFPVQIQPDENHSNSFDQVQRLFYRCSLQTDETMTTNFYFPNLTHLNVTLPYNQNLSLLIQQSNYLTSLDVSKPNDMSNQQSFEQLQQIIDHTNDLQSLKFSSWSDDVGILTPVRIRTRQIKRVHLYGYNRWFNDQDCFELAQSTLGQCCQILFIKVQNRSSIIQLIKSMSNLRSLICQVKDKDDHWQYNSTCITDSFIQRLCEDLDGNHSIERDQRYKHSIRIWIHS